VTWGEGEVGRVVVVDDHQGVRDAVRDLLGEVGVSVVGFAADGGEAVDLVGELNPDVVVLDLRMPAVGGLEALARIRDRDPDVQVIVFSADDDPETVLRSLRAGAAEHVTKGVAPSALCDAVARAVAAARRGRTATAGA
jgi:DNA-binding NarL/FixJ family response regulator